jgi:hypothetical protein
MVVADDSKLFCRQKKKKEHGRQMGSRHLHCCPNRMRLSSKLPFLKKEDRDAPLPPEQLCSLHSALTVAPLERTC